MFRVRGNEACIRYNPWIFGKYFQENLMNTVPHEVAHFIVHEVYGLQRIRPHGRQWQALMVQFGVDPRVTFDLDLTGIPQRRQRRYRYLCGCTEHALSSTRHRRVLAGTGRYQCRRCGQTLSAGREQQTVGSLFS